MKFASHYRIAGISDIKAKTVKIFLPFWLLTYDGCNRYLWIAQVTNPIRRLR